MFSDRLDAARQLSGRLKNYRGKHPLVLGIPRGAVPMAQMIASELNDAFDVVLVRKLRATGQPELAMGSVDENGCSYFSVS
jgi:predicted phosphoribosyltransferase